MTNKSKLRVLAAVLAALLILTALPGVALADSSFSAIVGSDGMKVYYDAGMGFYAGKLAKNTIVTVEAYSGNVAKISYRGKTGFAAVSDMSAVASVAKKAVTNTNTYVFKRPSTSSARMRVSKGVTLYVLAINGACAMVEKNGYVAYAYVGHLNIEGQTDNGGTDVTPPSTDDQPVDNNTTPNGGSDSTQTPTTMEEIFSSGKYSNEELIYAFAVKKMGFNSAAACGLLANIKAESSFKPTTVGDSGTSYGICQWHAGRKTRLINWCDSNGYDYKTLLGQLYFLKYELENFYPSVNSYMKGVENSAQGAYDSGYHFCYNFEAPANRASRSATRAASAKDTYWAKYGA